MKKSLVSFIIMFIWHPAFAQVAQQRQEQGQRQDQISNQRTVITFAGKKEAVAARAYAYVAPNTAKCYETYGAGVQGMEVGITISGSYESLPCNILAFFAVLKSIGRDEEAEALLRQYKPVDAAYKEVEKQRMLTTEDIEHNGLKIDLKYPPYERRR